MARVEYRDDEVVQRLRPLPCRPPEFRFGNLQAQRAGALCAGHHAPLAETLNQYRRNAVPPRELRSHFDRNASVVVMLDDMRAGETVGAPAFEPDIAPDAHRDQARGPVPPELARLLAQAHGIAHRIAVLARRRETGALRAEVLLRAVKDDAQLVPPRAQPSPDRP